MSIIDFPNNSNKNKNSPKNNSENSKQDNNNNQNKNVLKPYLIRAIYEWTQDFGYKPYLAVEVDKFTRVPNEYVKNGNITLNLNREAVNKLEITNDYVYFWARFAGIEREIYIPIGRVVAIYAVENGMGLQFPAEDTPNDDPPNQPKGLKLVD